MANRPPSSSHHVLGGGNRAGLHGAVLEQQTSRRLQCAARHQPSVRFDCEVRLRNRLAQLPVAVDPELGTPLIPACGCPNPAPPPLLQCSSGTCVRRRTRSHGLRYCINSVALAFEAKPPGSDHPGGKEADFIERVVVEGPGWHAHSWSWPPSDLDSFVANLFRSAGSPDPALSPTGLLR